MNNINIKNIFDNNYNLTKSININLINNSSLVNNNSIVNNDNDNYSIKNISVNNLTSSITNKHIITDDFIINKIKYNEITEKKKLKELYDTKYSECLIKINNGIDICITDIFFEITNGYFGYKSYNSRDCLEYIQKKLRKRNFNTLIISNTRIFISWKNNNNLC